MKKRSCCILLALSIAAALAACGGGSESPNGQNTEGPALPTQSAGSQTDAGGYTFAVSKADNYIVAIDDNMADVLAALGEPLSYFEAASCAFEGLDKTYTYSGFVITTRPDGDQDYVNSIRLTDDSAVTPEGIYIGCPADDVTAAYGEGSRTENVIRYTKGNSAMNFILEDGKVISIEYLPA